jgi:microcystin-dependent protein
MRTVYWKTGFVMALCMMTAFLVLAQPKEARAGTEAYIGEIMMVAFNYCPQNSLEANGQLLQISQYTPLYALIGTYYGGDGVTTFALPDLRGRVAVGNGAGPGLSNYYLGDKGGTETVTLTQAQMPSHTHTINAYSVEGDSAVPTDNVPAKSGAGDPDYSSSAPDVTMAADTVSSAGGNQPHENRPPFLTLKFCIVVNGIWPTRP